MKFGIMRIDVNPKSGEGLKWGRWTEKSFKKEGERIYKALYKESGEIEYLWKRPMIKTYYSFYYAVLYEYMVKTLLDTKPELLNEYERIKEQNENSWLGTCVNSGINKAFLSWYEDYLREQADPGILEREKRQREVDAYIARTRYEREQAEREAHQVRCPYCNSTRTEKIGAVSRAVSISMTGLASGKIGKQWHCKDCKSDF